MAYTCIGFKDGSTPLDATNMNKMDNQIKANADDIDSLSTDLANNAITANSLDELLTAVNALPLYSPRTFWLKDSGMSSLTDSAVSVNGFGMAVRQTSTIIDVFCNCSAGRVYFSRRYTNGTAGDLFILRAEAYATLSVNDITALKTYSDV